MIMMMMMMQFLQLGQQQFYVLLFGCFREHKSMMQRKVLSLTLECLTSCRYLAVLADRSMIHLDMELLLQHMTNLHTICHC